MSCDVASINAALQALASLNTLEEQSTGFINTADIPPYLLLEETEIADKLRLVATLPAVAKQIGTEKTREQMLPLLDGAISSAIENGDDELCLAMANQVSHIYVF